MSLAKKYGIPETAIKCMVKDGVIPCSVIRHDEIMSFYDSKVQAGVNRHEARKMAEDEFNISGTLMFRIIQRFR